MCYFGGAEQRVLQKGGHSSLATAGIGYGSVYVASSPCLSPPRMLSSRVLHIFPLPHGGNLAIVFAELSQVGDNRDCGSQLQLEHVPFHSWHWFSQVSPAVRVWVSS
jgi:hypothetical protein